MFKSIYKFFSLTFLVFLFAGFASAQIVFEDDFDAYAADQQLACMNPADWTTWSNLPCDATEDPFVRNTVAFSGSNSVNIVTNNDCVKPLGALTSGKYSIQFMMYVPTGFDGYFNTMQEWFSGNYQWGMQAYFPAGGNGTVDAGGASSAVFTFPHDTWFPIEVQIDLDIDFAEFYVDNVFVVSWQWSTGTFGTGTLNQLDASNFFGHDQTAGGANYYFDDYKVIDLLFVPVELTSFTATVNNLGNVVLNWATATELNNQMFEIERRTAETEFFTIGYVNGNGTSTDPHEYTYVDKTAETGTYFYRLKQLDFDGRYEYFDEIEVDVKGPLTFALEQNYPNPFNPSTTIRYSVPEAGYVKLAVYNLIGEEVAVLVDSQSEAGFFEVTFDAGGLPSGAYFYKLQSQNSVEVKKMLLTK